MDERRNTLKLLEDPEVDLSVTQKLHGLSDIAWPSSCYWRRIYRSRDPNHAKRPPLCSTSMAADMRSAQHGTEYLSKTA